MPRAATFLRIVLTAILALTMSASLTAAEDQPIVAEARALLDNIKSLGAEYNDLKTESKKAQDSDGKAVAELQARDRLLEWMRTVEALVANVLEQRDLGLDDSDFRQETRKLLWNLDRRIPTFIDEVSKENARLRSERESTSPESMAGVEARIRGNEETLDDAVRFFVSHINHMDRLELGSDRARSNAAELLEQRAGNLAARLALASQKLEELTAGAETAPDSEIDTREAQEDLDHLAASLWTTCDALDELDLPTAGHRRVLILATGELTTDVLDTEVLAELFESAIAASTQWFEQRGPVLIGRFGRFLGVLLTFWVLSWATRRLTTRFATSSSQQLSMLAQRIIVSTAARAVMGVGIVIALSQVGVNVTALLAGLGIVGFILGFALQDTLGNFAAGAMILVYDPFDVGDVIEAAGVMGRVDQMNLVSTTILTFDNQTLIVPNSRIWGNVIRNTTAMDERRVDLSFPLALDSDVKRAEALFEAMCRAHPAVLDDPEPAIKVQEVTGAGVLIVVRPWVKTTDYWPTFWDLNRDAHERLREAGIQIASARYKIEDPKLVDPK